MLIFKNSGSAVSIYFFLWCLYNLQGALYTTGGDISRLLLLIILIWSFFIMYKVNTGIHKLPAFIKAINVFLIFATLYGSFLIIGGEDLYITEGHANVKVPNFGYLKQIYMSFLPIYVYYYYTIKGQLEIRKILHYTIILLVVLIINYFDSRAELLQQMMHSDGFTMNIGYEFLALFPLLVFWNQRTIVQFILLLLSMLFIIICMKRGAILIAAFCFIYFLYNTITNTPPRKRFIVLLFSSIAVFAAVCFIANMMNSNDYFAYRIEKTLAGDSSNRDILYSTYWNHFLSETNFLRFFFGNGANATLKIGMNYAHNDWLELLINNGILGVFIYVFYFISLYKDAIVAKRVDRGHYTVMLLAFIILFCSSMFSMSYASINIALTLALGFSLGSVQIKSLQNQ